MTKFRKIGISLAFALLFIFACMCVVPLYSTNDNSNDVAYAVTVQSRDEWVNPYSGSYYAEFKNTNLTGAAFRTQLASLITRTHTKYTLYSGSSDLALNKVWPKSDVDPKNPNSGQMVWFYTGTLTSGSNFGSTAGTTNREHVWAKRGETNGAFNSDAKTNAGSDAHHLRPTEVNLNSARGDKWFDELTPGSSGVSIAAQNGSTTYGTAPDGLCYTNSNYFYPAKGYRGATARILFYVQTRWGDKYGLEFSDTLQHSNVKLIGIISTLMKWHLEEPPTEEEIYHNNIIAGIQGNRNPFIDHPEYAEMIYCYNGQSYNNKLQQVVAQYGSYLNGNVGGGGGNVTDPTPDLSNFESCLAAANSATTLEARHSAITTAIVLFNKMSSTEQTANRAALQKVIDAYNNEINAINGEVKEAVNVVSPAVAQSLTLALLGLATIVAKRTIGR